jgi:hypothetical protein
MGKAVAFLSSVAVVVVGLWVAQVIPNPLAGFLAKKA